MPVGGIFDPPYGILQLPYPGGDPVILQGKIIGYRTVFLPRENVIQTTRPHRGLVHVLGI